ncbi:hypothetical protein OG883_29755 [Streptomyces sp. NBC_01142]|uniref:hypothetical protein n=1 Tax=Streptomyces sp. NBC_01142 TaxID=2975865 RepID=UPI0022573841|nr:hypothetical protein [Streptomyces sp. NBC_01142]MCX4823988.1 hypothetical protein [Streptomyces sp. NBC_01142]
MTTAVTGVVVPGQAAAEVVSPLGGRVAPAVASPDPVPEPDSDSDSDRVPDSDSDRVPGRNAPPLPAPSPAGEMARSSSAAERLWLLGGVALSLAAAGVVAIAATRVRRNP